MELPHNEQHLSDDEIFIGKLSLKEVKMRVQWNNHHVEPKCVTQSNDNTNERSLKIIEIHSEPNLMKSDPDQSPHPLPPVKSVSHPSLSPEIDNAWEIKNEDDSFIKIEKMVSSLCVSPKQEKSVKLDNTLDVIDYILKNGPSYNYDNHEINGGLLEGNHLKDKLSSKITVVTPKKENPPAASNDKVILETGVSSVSYITPSKENPKLENIETLVTPCSEKKVKTPCIFKTPGNPVSLKKTPFNSAKKTPSRSKTFDHIASPVASYINNCPVVPLLKDVRPSKPLPGPSSIPKFVKVKQQSKPCNKENVNLPSIAYKSAKKTKVIAVPDEEKLPQSQWAKKITSSLPKPSVMKHDHREISLAKRVLLSRQEDSFGDLSLRQADVSVCTQKSAFNRIKKPITMENLRFCGTKYRQYKLNKPFSNAGQAKIDQINNKIMDISGRAIVDMQHNLDGGGLLKYTKHSSYHDLQNYGTNSWECQVQSTRSLHNMLMLEQRRACYRQY
ncbi:uncharacterized protein ACR2FA_010931 [Aphomia sociella]